MTGAATIMFQINYDTLCLAGQTSWRRFLATGPFEQGAVEGSSAPDVASPSSSGRCRGLVSSPSWVASSSLSVPLAFPARLCRTAKRHRSSSPPPPSGIILGDHPGYVVPRRVQIYSGNGGERRPPSRLRNGFCASPWRNPWHCHLVTISIAQHD